MKYLCLGYIDPKRYDALSDPEREAMMQECFAYDAMLKKRGHFVRGMALQAAASATTLRWDKGKVRVTDGPYAETKEQIGGILLLEARDRDQAIQLMAAHPGVRLGGPFEVRPVDDVITDRANAQPEAP